MREKEREREREREREVNNRSSDEGLVGFTTIRCTIETMQSWSIKRNSKARVRATFLGVKWAWDPC